MRLAVVVLSYNTRDLLRQALQSVLAAAARSADHLTVELLVVDNASADGSAAMVQAEFPQVHLIASAVNLGYTGGNNLALQTLGFLLGAAGQANRPPDHPAVPPDFVLLLNADAEIVGDALWQMVQVLVNEPTVGACGAQLQFGDGRFQHGAFAFPGLAQTALDLFPLTGLRGMHRLYASRWNGRYPQDLWQGKALFAVDFVLGAALMVRGAVISQIGGLDDGFFLYCEEMDWALRMHLAGWTIKAVPTAQVIHHEGQSSKQVRWPAFVRLWQSRLRFYAKYRLRYQVGYLAALRLLIWLGFWWRTQRADQRFAQGQLTGTEWQAERAAYHTIQQLLG